MTVGLPREIKNNEFRVGLTPAAAGAFVREGHTVLVQAGAGEGSGFTDREYEQAGCRIESGAEQVWARADMVVKVKEPIEEEYRFFRRDLILYTYLHLAADAPLTRALLDSQVAAVAYETITGPSGGLPCLAPMSEIAGRMAVQEGAKYLEKTFGGRGVLLGGVPGVERGRVVILGGGSVGTNAAKIAAGMGASVTVLDVNLQRLAYLDDIFGGRITTLCSTRENILAAIAGADLVVGAVLLPGRAAPKLLLREDLRRMKPGAVIVDVAVDQGGCAETSHPTTHADPVFTVDGIVHYCVSNMPGAVARTSTLALGNATLPYGLALARRGVGACREDRGLLAGLNCWRGRCTCRGVAEALGLEFTPPGLLPGEPA